MNPWLDPGIRTWETGAEESNLLDPNPIIIRHNRVFTLSLLFSSLLFFHCRHSPVPAHAIKATYTAAG